MFRRRMISQPTDSAARSSRALQRRGRVRQDGEAAIDATLPALRCLGKFASRKATEIP